MSKAPSAAARIVPVIASFFVSGLLGAAVAQGGASGIDVKALYISADTQTLTLAYGADLGFPLGPRSAQTVLDCKRGKVTTRGYMEDGDFLDVYADPATAAEDKPGAAALLKAGVVKVGQGKLSYTDGGAVAKFFCRGGLIVSDLSAYAIQPRASMVDTSVSSNLNVSSYAGGLPISVTLPGYAYLRDDELIGTGNVRLDFRGVSLSKADYLTAISFNRPFSGDREAVFLLETNGKGLRPIQYGSTEVGLRTAVPVKSGKGGTQVTLYYTPDYQGSSWQKLVLDLGTYQTWTSRVPKPANLKFGK